MFVLIFQYEVFEHAHFLFEVFNLSVETLLNRKYFQHRYWTKSNIDISLFNNISSKCYSIGYYFDRTGIYSGKEENQTMNVFLTVNPKCLHLNSDDVSYHNYSVFLSNKEKSPQVEPVRPKVRFDRVGIKQGWLKGGVFQKPPPRIENS